MELLSAFANHMQFGSDGWPSAALRGDADGVLLAKRPFGDTVADIRLGEVPCVFAGCTWRKVMEPDEDEDEEEQDGHLGLRGGGEWRTSRPLLRGECFRMGRLLTASLLGTA